MGRALLQLGLIRIPRMLLKVIATGSISLEEYSTKGNKIRSAQDYKYKPDRLNSLVLSQQKKETRSLNSSVDETFTTGVKNKCGVKITKGKLLLVARRKYIVTG